METAEDRLLERHQLFLRSLPDGRPKSFTLQRYGILRAASEYQLRPGSTGRLEQDRKTLRGTAAQRVAYKLVANGSIVVVELSALGSNQGQPGAHGDKRQLHRGKSSSSAVPPFVRPIASNYPPTLGSHGVPQWARGDDTDNILCYSAPQGRLSGAGGGLYPVVSHG